MTPAKFGPMACINKKLCGFASKPTLLATRAAIGTADTPAAPISGLIGFFDNLFINFAINTPLAVPTQKATAPRAKIPKVSTFKNLSADILDPTASPKKTVTVFIISF